MFKGTNPLTGTRKSRDQRDRFLRGHVLGETTTPGIFPRERVQPGLGAKARLSRADDNFHRRSNMPRMGIRGMRLSVNKASKMSYS